MYFTINCGYSSYFVTDDRKIWVVFFDGVPPPRPRAVFDQGPEKSATFVTVGCLHDASHRIAPPRTVIMSRNQEISDNIAVPFHAVHIRQRQNAFPLATRYLKHGRVHFLDLPISFVGR